MRTTPTPYTIQGLLAAYARGNTDLEQVFAPFITAAHQREQVAPSDAAWISRTPAAMLRQQLVALAGHSPATKPLYGIPFAVKDNIDVAGLPTTAACPEFAYMPSQSATAVQRLIDAGAVVVGKTNLDQFATGLVGTRSPYGAPTSTFSDAHVSGGSSSGSAVVVSRGEVAFALGTDTAGSGRVPAGFNNIVGLKPTPGLVPTTGVVPACLSLDCVSVFALTVADAARVLACIEGPDPGAPVFNPVPLQPPKWPSTQPLRVGIPTHPVFFGNEAYAQAFAQACAQLNQLQGPDGQAWEVSCVPIDLSPWLAVAKLLYEGPWVAERHVAMSQMLAAQATAVHPVVRGIVESASQYSAADAFRGLYALKQQAAQLMPLWHTIDVMMVPTAPTHPTRQAVDDDPVGANSQLGTYTNFVNLLGLSALSLPAQLLPTTTAAGLPFGITFIAAGGRDAALADLGMCWQRLTARAQLPLGHHLSLPSDDDLASPATSSPRAEPVMPLAVVGAHLAGMPLHGQLVERQAFLLEATQTSPHYQLFALPGTVPPKPGLARLPASAPITQGHHIAVEVYAVPLSQIGSFLALIPPPLGLGSIELADGRWVKGFICEPGALADAEDISHFGGWRAYMAHLKSLAA